MQASKLARAGLTVVFHRRMRAKVSWTRADFLAVVRQFSKDDIGGFCPAHASDESDALVFAMFGFVSENWLTADGLGIG